MKISRAHAKAIGILPADLPAAKANKYKAHKTAVNGIVFASGLEAERYTVLKLLEACGEISELELQPAFDLYVYGRLVCRYIADFRYLNIRGERVVEDAKGMKTPVYLLKKKLMRAVHGIEIREV